MDFKPVEEPLFLVDVNLPKKFQFFNTPQFVHVVDINPSMKDTEILDYALSRDMVILTRDADFQTLFITSKDFPKIVYFKLGNIKLSDLYQYFNMNWSIIIDKLKNSNFIIAQKNSITVFH